MIKRRIEPFVLVAGLAAMAASAPAAGGAEIAPHRAL